MARLGTRTPGGRTYDIHQGDFRVDERAVRAGALLLARAALLTSAHAPGTDRSGDGVGNVPNP
jgi:amidohydrolase